MIVMLHIYIFLYVFHIFDYLPKWHINKVEIGGNINVMCFAFALLISLFFFFKRKNLSQYDFSENELNVGWKSLLVYNGVMLTILIIITSL